MMSFAILCYRMLGTVVERYASRFAKPMEHDIRVCLRISSDAISVWTTYVRSSIDYVE
jgi:hypothetical protein